jgi:TPR repeat protein
VTSTGSVAAEESGAVSRPDAKEIALMLNRAADFFAQGDYASARPLLQRAAAAGSALAALMLGATFDPLVAQPIGGVKSDVALARQWYQRATELGSDAASQQLANLAKSEK